MCQICIEFNKLTLIEVKRNLYEMKDAIGSEHAVEVAKKIIDKYIDSVIFRREMKKQNELNQLLLPFITND